MFLIKSEYIQIYLYFLLKNTYKNYDYNQNIESVYGVNNFYTVFCYPLNPKKLSFSIVLRIYITVKIFYF